MALFGSLLAAPPLTEPDRAQLATAQDRSARADEAALYPLLRNALEWDGGDESGAAIPDYAALLAEPADHRGGLFLIEGRFAGHNESFGPRVRLARPGPWGEALTQWGVVVDDTTRDAVVVYFVDPAGGLVAPRRGQRVRVAARFYKVLSRPDLNDRPADFLLFVARSAKLVPGGSAPGAYSPVIAMAVVVLLLFVAFVLLRLWAWKRRSVPQRATRSLPAREPAPGLPEDPADALAELERQRADEKNG